MSKDNVRLLLAFFYIYMVWGWTTYLAIQGAVAPIPPLAAAGVRGLVAGTVLYVWGAGMARAAFSATRWRASLVVAVLFLPDRAYGTMPLGRALHHLRGRGAARRDRANLDRDADAARGRATLERAHDRGPGGRPGWRGAARSSRGVGAGVAAGVGLGRHPRRRSRRGPSACGTRRPRRCRETRSCAPRPRCCAAPCCSSRRAPRPARSRTSHPSAISSTLGPWPRVSDSSLARSSPFLPTRGCSSAARRRSSRRIPT